MPCSRYLVYLQSVKKVDTVELIIRTKSHLGTLGFWALPYIIGIVLFWCLLLAGPFGFMIYLSVASGYYEPIYRSIPLEMILLFFIVCGLPKFLRCEFCTWETIVGNDHIQHSFGIWNQTVRRWKDFSQLSVEKRNNAYFRYDEPTNPAEEFPHGVIVYLADWIWADIPCSDEQEVDHLFDVLTNSVCAATNKESVNKREIEGVNA